MRDIVLVLGLAAFLPMSLFSPAAGAICWAWFSIMSPHRQVYSFAAGAPLNSAIALATLFGWLLSKERKHWTPDLMPWLMLAWVAWMTFNSVFAPFQDWSWDHWDLVIRILALIFLVFFVATTKARIHGFVWVLVIAVGYYGVKGGVFTLMTGGGHVVYGPPSTMISDNNQLALAVVMLLPLVNYLRIHTKMRLLRIGLAISIGVQILMVLGSHSRGGVIALAACLGMFWLRSRNKISYAVIGTVVVGVALSLMPPEFWERLNTLHDVNSDASFHGRVVAWKVATLVAIDRFPFGAGFYGPQVKPLFNFYFPDEDNHAAHSIYFQMLGEHGFIGLGLYLLILLLALRNTWIVMRQTRERAELRWAYDLANMTQVSLVGFYVGGAALSVAYYDGYLLMIALMSTLRELTAPAKLPKFATFERTGPLATLDGQQPVRARLGSVP